MLPPVRKDGVVVVTGASSGIGEQLAREFARRGYRLVLVARRADRLRELAETLGDKAHVLATDLSIRAERATLPDEIAALGVVVDVLVNNAGMTNLGPMAESDPDDELRLIDVDVARSSICAVGLCQAWFRAGAARCSTSHRSARSARCPGRPHTARPRRSCCPTPTRCEKNFAAPASRRRRCARARPHGFGEAAGIPDDEAEKSLPKFLWQEADAVAKAAVDGLASGKGVIVPGMPNRIAAVINHPCRDGCCCRWSPATTQG